MTKNRRVAVVGAGMAGLAAAAECRAGGCDVTVFEKSRGLGGRMATRRVDGLTFDHGAQFFTAHGPVFSARVAEWQRRGAVTPWFDASYVGCPGMADAVRMMADDLTIMTRQTVTALTRLGDQWQLSLSAVEGSSEVDGFDAVILALPAPQIETLLVASSLTQSALARSALRAVRYAPCWAVMVAFDKPLIGVADHQKPDHPKIAWIARNSSKPGRDGQACYVVHATPEWSRVHFEIPAEEARDRLLKAFLTLVGDHQEPAHLSVHRWRYALVEQAAGSPFLWDANLALGACGDWCLGPRIEAAFDSGHALGRQIVAALPALV